MAQTNLQTGCFNQKGLVLLFLTLVLLFTPWALLFAETAGFSEIKSAINVYFAGEKTGSLIKIAIAIVTATVGVFAFKRGPFGRGMAYFLLLMAFIELMVGGTVYLRTDAQVAGFFEQIQTEPALFQLEESARMSGVLSNFAILRVAQIGLFVIGLILFFIAKFRNRPTVQGIGTGLFISGPILLVMDLLGAARAEVYFEALQKMGG